VVVAGCGYEANGTSSSGGSSGSSGGGGSLASLDTVQQLIDQVASEMRCVDWTTIQNHPLFLEVPVIPAPAPAPAPTPAASDSDQFLEHSGDEDGGLAVGGHHPAALPSLHEPTAETYSLSRFV
jgi:hypothetical protein